MASQEVSASHMFSIPVTAAGNGILNESAPTAAITSATCTLGQDCNKLGPYLIPSYGRSHPLTKLSSKFKKTTTDVLDVFPGELPDDCNDHVQIVSLFTMPPPILRISESQEEKIDDGLPPGLQLTCQEQEQIDDGLVPDTQGQQSLHMHSIYDDAGCHEGGPSRDRARDGM